MEKKKIYKKCTQCGRNFRADDPRFKRCPECAKMDYLYGQGAITLEQYKSWEKDWIRNF